MRDNAGHADFRPTHWSAVVLAARGDAPGSAAAMEELCRTYWYPLYVFARRRGLAAEHAADVTQDFFLRIIEHDGLGKVDPAKGRFRSFLLATMTHVLDDDTRRAGTLKRGGGRVPVSLDVPGAELRFLQEPATAPPEMEFDRQWAEALVARALERVRLEWERGDAAGGRFAALRPFLLLGRDGGRLTEIAAGLGMTEAAARSLVHRLRVRFRDLLRAEVAQMVPPGEAEEELRYLLNALSA